MLVLKWSRDQHGLQRVRQASATETHQDKGGLRHRTGGGLLPSPALGAQGWRPPAGGAPAPQEPGLPPAPETPVFIRDPRAPARSPLTLRAPSPHPSPPGLWTGAGQGLLPPRTTPRPSHPLPSHLLKPLSSDSEAVLSKPRHSHPASGVAAPRPLSPDGASQPQGPPLHKEPLSLRAGSHHLGQPSVPVILGQSL